MRINRADQEKIKELALEFGVEEEVIKEIIFSQYKFIKNKSKEISFEDGLTKDEFIEKKKNFNIPSIGKLYASHFMYNEIQKKKNNKNLPNNKK